MPLDTQGELARIGAQETGVNNQQAALASDMTKSAEGRSAETAPILQGINQTQGEQAQFIERRQAGRPQIPEFKAQPPVSAKEFEGLSMAMIGMAMIGGIASKGNWLGASASLNGAMKGFIEGNHELAEKNYKDYNEKFKTAIAKEKSYTTETEDILKAKDLSINQKLTQLKIVAAKYDKQDMLAAGRQKSLDGIRKSIEGQRTSVLKMQEHYDTVQMKVDAERQRAQEHNDTMKAVAAMRQAGAGGNGFEGRNGEILAAMAEQGVSLPAGFRAKSQQLGLLNAISRRNPDLTPDEIATKIKSGQLDLKGLTKEVQVAGAAAGKIAYAENEIEQTIPLVREASAKLPRGKFVPYEKLKQMGEKDFSDPDLAEFKMYMTSLSNAYDMLSARGGTDVEKRAEGRKNFDTAQSPEALDRVLEAVRKEAKASGRAARASMDVTHKGGAVPPTNAQGWTLHTDKNGNKAYVSPDGKQFEEAK